MNLFAMKASYPLDELTAKELQALVTINGEKDQLDYNRIMDEEKWMNIETRGFFILAYDDDEDMLIGAINAVDNLGLNAFEWSILVDVDYRNIGIEEVLIEGLKHGLDERQAAGEMAVVFSQQELNPLLSSTGYQHNGSKIVMKADAQIQTTDAIQVMPYEAEDLTILQQLMADGFQDLPEETEEFIELISDEQSSQVWMVRQEGQIVATLTTAVVEQDIWVTAFTTATAFRKRGIALSLLNWVKNYAAENKLARVLLEVESDNPSAFALYEKADFENIEQQDYYIEQ